MRRIPFELKIKGRTAGIKTPVSCPISGPFFVAWRLGYCDWQNLTHLQDLLREGSWFTEHSYSSLV